MTAPSKGHTTRISNILHDVRIAQLDRMENKPKQMKPTEEQHAYVDAADTKREHCIRRMVLLLELVEHIDRCEEVNGN